MNAMSVNPEFVLCKSGEGHPIFVNRTLVASVRDLWLDLPYEAELQTEAVRRGEVALCYVYQYDGRGMYLAGTAEEVCRRLGTIVVDTSVLEKQS